MKISNYKQISKSQYITNIFTNEQAICKNIKQVGEGQIRSMGLIDTN